MIKRLLYIFCLSLLLSGEFEIAAQLVDDNIVITSSEEIYTVRMDGARKTVHVRLSAEYEATRMGERFQVGTYYGDHITIERAVLKGIGGKVQYRQVIPENVFYDDTKWCYFDMNLDRKGKKVQVVFEKVIQDLRYFTTLYLPDPYFVRQKTIRVIVPKAIRFDIQEFLLPSTVISERQEEEKTGNIIYTYSLSQQQPYKQEDNAPHRAYLYPHLQFVGEFSSCHELYQWLHALTEKQDTTSSISQLVGEITAGCGSDTEKAAKILNWTQENIRYIAFENGISGFQPDKASEVLRKRYGDCKGMSALLKSMLLAAKLDARLCWIGTNAIAADFTTTPSLASGNHMICALIRKGSIDYLDPTLRYMPLGVYPHHLQGRQVLIENGDSCLVQRIPIADASQNTDSLYCEYTLSDAQLEGKAYRSFSGDRREELLQSCDKFSANHRSEFLNHYMIAGKTGIEVKNMTPDGSLRQTPDADFIYTVSHTSACVWAGDECYIELEPGIDNMIQSLDTLDRRHGWLLPFPYRSICTIVFTIPDGYDVSHLPSATTIHSSQGVFRLSYTQEKDKIIYHRDIRIEHPLIERNRMTQWNQEVRQFTKNCLEQVVLVKIKHNV